MYGKMDNKKTIKVVSDVHLEFHKTIDPVTSQLGWEDGGDVVILAGDIGQPFSANYHSFLSYASHKFDKVMVIAGNHEYWSANKTYDKINGKLNELSSEFSNVYFLHNTTLVTGGVKYIGTTLWSDVSKNSYKVKEFMNDYSKIKHYVNGIKKKITPSQTCIWHQNAVEYLKSELEDTLIPTVVISHHLPSFQSLKGDSKGGLREAYATNLESLLKFPVKLWVHGHNHQKVDYKVGPARVVCNPLGYPDENCGYDPNLEFKM